MFHSKERIKKDTVTNQQKKYCDSSDTYFLNRVHIKDNKKFILLSLIQAKK